LTLDYMHYTFVRVHDTLRVTNRVWSIEDIIGLLERAGREPAA